MDIDQEIYEFMKKDSDWPRIVGTVVMSENKQRVSRLRKEIVHHLTGCHADPRVDSDLDTAQWFAWQLIQKANFAEILELIIKDILK